MNTLEDEDLNGGITDYLLEDDFSPDDVELNSGDGGESFSEWLNQVDRQDSEGDVCVPALSERGQEEEPYTHAEADARRKEWNDND